MEQGENPAGTNLVTIARSSITDSFGKVNPLYNKMLSKVVGYTKDKGWNCLSSVSQRRSIYLDEKFTEKTHGKQGIPALQGCNRPIFFVEPSASAHLKKFRRLENPGRQRQSERKQSYPGFGDGP